MCLIQAVVVSIAVACFAVFSVEAAEAGPGKGYQQIPPGAFSVVAEVRAKPGKEDALRAATLPLIEPVRSDPNNLVYFLQEDRQSPSKYGGVSRCK